MRKLLEAAAAERPLVCVFDDVHWGEDTFLDLVEQVAALARGVPLLCLHGQTRPARQTGQAGAASSGSQPLSDDEADLLIEELLGGAPLDASLRERIRGAAEGNPLFVEEMIAMLRDAHDGDVASRRRSRRCSLRGSTSFRRPSARCWSAARSQGRVFHLGAVQVLAPEQAQLGAALASLVRKDLSAPIRTSSPATRPIASATP